MPLPWIALWQNCGNVGRVDSPLLLRNSPSVYRVKLAPISKAVRLVVLLNVTMNCPHPQPFSPRRRALRVLFPLRWERARVRAAKDSNLKVILLFSNAWLVDRNIIAYKSE